MKTTFLTFNCCMLLACLLATPCTAQTGGGAGGGGGGAAGGGAAGGGTSGGSGASAGANGAVGGANAGGNAGAGANVNVPAVREPLPPIQNGTTTPGAGAQGNGSVNGGNSPSAGFNAGSGVNNGNGAPAPTSRPGIATNRMYSTNAAMNPRATNSITGTNGSGIGRQDLALTEFDRHLIMRFRATLIQRLGGTAAAWAPVTFQSDNGVVTVGGAVPSIVIKQRVVATLQTFPGVVRVLDQLEVDANMGASAPGASVVPNPRVPGEVPAGASSNGAELSPTGRPVTPVPRAFPGAPTNAVVPGATPR